MPGCFEILKFLRALRCVCSTVATTIIDDMVNVQLMFGAANMTGAATFLVPTGAQSSVFVNGNKRTLQR